MDPYLTCPGKMPVSVSMRILNYIASDWNLPKFGCLPHEQKLFCWGRADKTASRILKNSARNN